MGFGKSGGSAVLALVVATGCAAEIGPSGSDGETETNESAIRGGGAGTCTVAPNPVAVGVDYVVSAGGMTGAWDVRVDVTDASGTRSFAPVPDADGNVSVAVSSTVAGSGSVDVYQVRRGREWLRATCIFEVTSGTSSCTPTTCAAAGAECGALDDGCGGVLDCGGCTSPDSCGGGGVANTCGAPPCNPFTCSDLGAECGAVADGCGGTIDCGTCTSPESCGGGGSANLCGTAACTPVTCAAVGAECGTTSDGCGGVLDCGGCASPETCGGGGVDNVCACTPRTCAAAGAECGAVDDGCGGILDCGGCASPETCGGGGVANVCGGDGSSSWPADWSSLEEEVLVLLNRRRAAGASCGSSSMPPAPPLTMEPQVRQAARLHSLDMAENDYFSHTSQDGRTFLTRMVDAGWAGSCPCGENIAAGHGTAASVVDAWMASTGHCLNIMDPDYGAVGAGFAYTSTSRYARYWTLDFAAY